MSGLKGLMDAYLAMIPFVDGDSTPSCQRSLCVLPVVCRLWASLRLTHLKERVQNWIPQSVFSLGNEVSSDEAWFSIALDIEEVSSGGGGDQLHVIVADVIESFDTVDRYGALGRFGFQSWFRKLYFSLHSQVRLRFKLAARLGELRCWGHHSGMLRGRQGFTRQPENSKRVHFRAPALQTPPKFHERTPKREKKSENGGGRGEKQ